MRVSKIVLPNTFVQQRKWTILNYPFPTASAGVNSYVRLTINTACFNTSYLKIINTRTQYGLESL